VGRGDVIEANFTTAQQRGSPSIYSLYGEHSPLVSFQAAGLTGEKNTFIFLELKCEHIAQ
jgi:hypothetical protein